MANDRLEHFALVERTNNGSDHVHQFEVLPFHVASEQALRIRSEFKKSAVKVVSELSTDRPDLVERLSDKLSLFRRHEGNRRNSPSGIRWPRSRPRGAPPLSSPGGMHAGGKPRAKRDGGTRSLASPSAARAPREAILPPRRRLA